MNKKFKYIIKKKEDEINIYYNIRKKFINTLKPKNKKEYNIYELYSHILINILFLKCRYHKDTENTINNYIQKYKNNFNFIHF